MEFIKLTTILGMVVLILQNCGASSQPAGVISDSTPTMVNLPAPPQATVQPESPAPPVDLSNSCTKISLDTQSIFGPPCLSEMQSQVTIPEVESAKAVYINLNDMVNLKKFEPEMPGSNRHFFAADLGQKKVFIKFMLQTKGMFSSNPDLTNTYFNKNSEESVNFFFKELFFTEKLSEYDLGPKLFGVTFMEIEHEPNKKVKGFALITKYVEGKVYRIFMVEQHLIPKNILEVERPAFKAFIPRFKEFINKFNIKLYDLQYLIDSDNNILVIDPGEWTFNKKPFWRNWF